MVKIVQMNHTATRAISLIAEYWNQPAINFVDSGFLCNHIERNKQFTTKSLVNNPN